MKNRPIVIGVAIAVVLGLVLIFVLRPPPPPPVHVPKPQPHVLKPKLAVFPRDAGALGDGEALLLSEPFDLRMTVASKAYTYLWDDYDNMPELMAPPASTPWETGEYSAESPSFNVPGEHRLVLVASPEPLPHPEEWRALQPEIITKACPECEFDILTVMVVAGVPDAGTPRTDAGLKH